MLRSVLSKLTRTQMTIVLCGGYIAIALVGNIAATKVTLLGPLVMDAGFIFALTFTWRDLIHKQLGKAAAVSTIWTAAVINLLAALYFQLVVMVPAESEWAALGGQAAWEFLFSIQLRIVIGSIVAMVVSELIDTQVYSVWVKRYQHWPQWTRVIASNLVSIPVDSVLFPIVAFGGILPVSVLVQMFWAGVIVKAGMTAVSFWMIYLVPDEPVYKDDPVNPNI